MEEAQREKDELIKNMTLLQQEKEQLETEKESLHKECEQEKETCAQLRRENQVSWEWTESIFEDSSASNKDDHVCCCCKTACSFLLYGIVVLGS